MTDIFISYSRVDRPRIEKLAAALEREGLDVWWDRNIAAGAEFSRETETRLNEARLVIVAWSRASIDSMWVADEASVGRDGGKLIPILIDDVQPKLGFRQIQTIDFVKWNGSVAGQPLPELLTSIRARLAAARPIGAEFPPLPARPAATSPKVSMVVALIAGAIALAALAFFAQLFFSPQAAPPLVAADTPAAAKTFATDDEGASLTLLESLAADLERKGEFSAAASAYSRVAARALLVDRGRGLAARRKAFDLDPTSTNAFQGLFFDTLLIKGADDAKDVGLGVIQRTDVPDEVRGFAMALLGTVEVDRDYDIPAAQARLAAVRAIEERKRDNVFAFERLWLESLIDLRLGAFKAALEKAEEADALQASLPPETPRNGEVMIVRIKFESGDWDGAIKVGAAALDRRQRNGEFVAWPILRSVCLSGVFLGRLEETAPYCQSISGKGERESGAEGSFNASIYDAARGDFDDARRELAAAEAMGIARPDRPASEADNIELYLYVKIARLFIAARSGDYAEASRIIDSDQRPDSDNEAIRNMQRVTRATSARLLADALLDAGEQSDGCAAAARAAEFYRQMNAAPGADGATALARRAGCR